MELCGCNEDEGDYDLRRVLRTFGKLQEAEK
jgi:hypothetical protein